MGLFIASEPQTFTIVDTADGSLVTPIDLGGNYKIILVTCADCQYIAASTNLTARVGYGAADGPFDLYEQDDPSSQWSKGALPTSGTLAFVLTHAAGIRRLGFTLSNASSGGSTVFTVKGLDEGI
jgi:hypothetical protein